MMDPQNLNVSLHEQPTIQCSNCDSPFFKPVVILKTVSKFITGAPDDTLAPIQVFRCDDCGYVPLEILPRQIQQLFEPDNTDGKDKNKDDEAPKSNLIIT